MTVHRRKFLRQGSLLASGILMAGMACRQGQEKTGEASTVKELPREGEAAAAPAGTVLPAFGIQLYTLREDLPKDPKSVLKQLSVFGFEEIEGYEGDQGMFWGMGNKGFKKYVDELGLTMVSSHCDINKDFERKAAEAAEVGMKYLISPYIGPQKTVDEYKKFAETFNQRGEVCKKNGIRFAYHNHGYTFTPLEGQMPQDILMQGTDPALVDFEMDIYWVVTGGADPEAWLNKYPNRFTLCHIKDRMKTAPKEEQEASCDLGTGSIDFAKVLRTATDRGMKHFIMEQERYDGSTPLKSAEAGAGFLKKLMI
jgi:sugar phosphate isomerase/epimerase